MSNLFRLGGPCGPLVVTAPEVHPWRGLQGWRVVEPGVWQGARWGRGTLIMAKESEAKEEA